MNWSLFFLGLSFRLCFGFGLVRRTIISPLPRENLGTVAAAILMASPVLGLRPIRASRLPTLNVPNPVRVTHLKVTDIDSQRIMLRVDQGKGWKDRYVMLSPRLLEVLRAYWKGVRPALWLFPGDLPDQPITRNAC